MRIYSFKSLKSQGSKKAWLRKFKKYLPKKGAWLLWLFRAVVLGFVLMVGLSVYYYFTLPNPNKLLARTVPESTKILARDGSLLYEVHGEVKRTLVNLDQISPQLKQATIAIEDKDFYKHGGISITGLIRSLIVDAFTLSRKQGGSTITQQFVKNAMLSREKSPTRKLKELILSLEIEARFNKDDILKLYLNEIPYGRNAYGIEAAAQAYFGKHANELNLAESAYLAALPQAPTYYNPLGPNRKALDNRKNTILDQMKQQGYISEDQMKEAQNLTVAFNPLGSGIKAPHFVFYVEDYLANKYGELSLEQGGLKVYTTLDPKLQDIAEQAINNQAEKNVKNYNAHNEGLVAIDPKTGQILAMVGSKNYFGDVEPTGCTAGKNCLFEGSVNVATAERQPGSSFKPYVYVTAFGKDFGYSPASPIFDVTTNFGTVNGRSYIPKNYNSQEYGPLTMRQALAGSLNVPAVKTLSLVGVDNAVSTARSLGITSPLQNCGLSLVLGGCEVKLIDHVAAFAALANGGVKHEKTAILKVVDKNNNTLEEYQDKSSTILDPQAVYQLTSIMTDNNARSFIFGSNSPLAFKDRQVACKTGTTQNWHDGWTLCFTPSLSVGVWAGNNDGTFLKARSDGVVVAAPIVHEVMTKALSGTPAEEFKAPSGITHVTVDKLSGKLPTQYSGETRDEVFADYNAPTKYDDVHVAVQIDSLTGQPANDTTPPERIQTQIYTVLHSERPDNPAWENPVIAWALAHGFNYPPGDAVIIPPPSNNGGGVSAEIISPQDGATITSLPLSVSVLSSNPDQINHIDLLVDGELIQSSSNAPYVFSINKAYSDGSHTLSVHVVGKDGKTSDTSISVIFALNESLIIIEPYPDQALSFPQSLTAQSDQIFDLVSFYYQISSTTKLIGTVGPVSNNLGGYNYNLIWKTAPKSGSYKIYARSNTGINSNKITVSVP